MSLTSSEESQTEPRSLEAWLSYLEHIHSAPIDMGLDRVIQVAKRLDVLQPAPQVILVAGTNGKGSTVALSDLLLRSHGLRTATYTSPHFIDYKERVRIQGQELTEQEHCQAFATVEKARGDISLTYFEFGTLAALWLIQQAQVDMAILEIGLGGRLDAVNIVEPSLSIVTRIGVDHTDYLGESREGIGFEKAGIYRSHTPAICGDREPPQSLLDHAQAIQAPLYRVGVDYDAQIEGNYWHFSTQHFALSSFSFLPLPRIPLENVMGVLAGLQLLSINLKESTVQQTLSQLQLPGRFEQVQEQPRIIFDVGHNPQAAEFLYQKIEQAAGSSGRILAVCGMLKDKDIAKTLGALIPAIDAWYFAGLEGPRAALASELTQHLIRQVDGACIQEFDQVSQAYQQALQDAQPEDTIVCFGSFLTIAALYRVLGRKVHVE